MPSVTQIISIRQGRQRIARRSPLARLGLGCSLLLSLLAAAGSVTVALLYTSLTQGLPSLNSLPALLEPPGGLLLHPTRLYDRSGEHLLLTLENPAASGRSYLFVAAPAEDRQPGSYLPPAGLQPGAPDERPLFASSLISATLAATDPAFWDRSEASLFLPGGQPALAQSLVSDLLMWDQPAGLKRSLQERLLAAQILTHYGRPKVLEWYLNSANYGSLAYGADAAARVYLGKSARQLTIAEAALLAAAIQAPALNPLDAPRAALERQKNLIGRMEDLGLISAGQAEAAREEKLALAPAAPAGQDLAPAFLRLALEQMDTQIERSRLERGGFVIRTSLDYDLQVQAACAAATQLARLDAPQSEEPAAGGLPCEAARLLPTLPGGHGLTAASLAASVVALDVRNGEVLALAGGPEAGLDPAHLPGRPAGTLISPFIYLTAFTRGMGPASLVWDIPGQASKADGETGTASAAPVENFDGQFHGPMRLRTALANDFFVPAAGLLAQLGSENVQRAAQQLGLDISEPGEGPAPALEEQPVTLLAASQAFGVIANGGTQAGRAFSPAAAPGKLEPLRPVTILQMEDSSGKPWLDWSQAQTRPVITPQLAYLLNSALSDEPARWPTLGHPNPLEIGRPAAAKLGRTRLGSDSWTVGYTPQVVVGVWAGYRREPETGQTPPAPLPPTLAAGLWRAVLLYAVRDLPAQDWTAPAGISTLQVCDPSGMLPSADCPNLVGEVFLAGSEPTQSDTLYRKVDINRETGRLATIFTPPELVEARVYMDIPPEALRWAQQAGVEVPPDSYDIISTSPPASPNAQIASPEIFATVGGVVSLQGTAGGEAFDYYRMQVGKGLNPQAWVQIGQDISTPVADGKLADWDTQGLSGLYTVQLIVVRQDQKVDTHVIQVTVDNQPPEVLVISPAPGQEFAAGGRRITFNATVKDDLAVEQVEFFVNGKQVEAADQPPFTADWQPAKGEHTLLVKAVDKAGNAGQSEVNFTVK